mgnify:CR=1 FL=1
MHFSLTEDQIMIRDAAREFAQNEIAPVAAEFDLSGEFPAATIKAAAELGRPLVLTDDRTLSQVNQVFRTLGTLADYIHLRLNERNDG